MLVCSCDFFHGNAQGRRTGGPGTEAEEELLRLVLVFDNQATLEEAGSPRVGQIRQPSFLVETHHQR